MSAAAAALIAVIALSCGPPPALRRQAVYLPLPELPTHLVRRVDIPERTSYAPVPLVIILDDGPPVDADRERRAAGRIRQLYSSLLQAGYALWRPLENAWPTDSLLVRCPDELAAQVRLGLLGARQAAFVDSSRIVLLGFGQGGVIGVMVTQRMTREVHALGLIGAPARAIDRILTSSPLRDSVVTGRMQRVFDDLRAGLYNDSDAVLNGTAGCWRAWLSITDGLVDVVQGLPQPVLAVQGTADSLLPLLDIERFRSAIQGRPFSRAESAVGLKHDLSDQVPDPKQPAGVLSPRLTLIVMNWLRQVASLPGAP